MKFPQVLNKVAAIVSVLSLLVSIGLMIGLAAFYLKAKGRLKDAATNLHQLGNQSIYYVAAVSDSIPLHTAINITNQVPVQLLMKLSDSLRIVMPVTYNHTLNIPVNLNIDKVLHIDTLLELPEPLKLAVNGNIPVDQKFEMVSLGHIKIKVKADIPIDEQLNARLSQQTRFKSDIPIRMQIKDHIPVVLNLRIPVNQKIKIDLPIKNMAQVGFPGKLNITGMIPIHLKVPVNIPLAKTPLKYYLDKTADDLDALFSF